MNDEADHEKSEWGPLAPILVLAPVMLLLLYALDAVGFERGHWGVLAVAGFSASLATSWLWTVWRNNKRR